MDVLTRPDVAPSRGPGAAPGDDAGLTDRLLHGTGRRSRTIATFLRQLPFPVALAALVAWQLTDDPALLRREAVFSGLLVVLLATALPLVVPWHRVGPGWTVVVPLLDILAVVQLNVGGFPVSEALVLPVIWMASGFGLPGTAASVVLGVVATWSSLLAAPTQAESRHVVLLPLVLVGAAVFTYLTERRSRGRQDLLRRQSLLVEEILEDDRARRETVEAILNTIDVGVVVLGPDGRVTLANRTHNLTLGARLRPGDPVDVVRDLPQYHADGTTPLDPEDSPFFRAVRGEHLRHVVIWADLGDGEEQDRRAYRISVEQLRADGEALGAVLAYQDLTAEMEALNQLDDFVSSVTHELRTPLTSIVGYLDLALEDEHVPEETRAFLEVANRNSERLLALIGDLLTAAQARRGELEVRASRVDLREVVHDAVQSEEPRALEAGITILNYVLQPCVVRVDRTRIGQVVDNLLSNAIKYSRPQGTVEVRLAVTEQGVRLSVADDGIGISAEDQERLFHRFFRARAVRKSAVQGTGLGLHISRQIVEAHGGTIEVESELGKGTCFTVCLPAGVLEAA